MSDDILRRLREPPFGTETSERNIMSAAADAIERLTAERDAAWAEVVRLQAYYVDVMSGALVPELEVNLAKARELLVEAHELLHKLTAIIPGNDGAGKDTAIMLARIDALLKEIGHEG